MVVQTHISAYKGKTVAVDTYSWLHKACCACAAELCQNIETDVYVKFCMTRVQLLVSHGVIPLMVFDGRYLPAKEAKEKQRAASRSYNLLQAQKLMKIGNLSGADKLFQKCVDVTPAMAHRFIRALRKSNISYIVAPYEADAQLAYLANQGYAHAVITEDSDLLTFGVKEVLLKMDKTGACQSLRMSRVNLLRTINLQSFTHEMFVMMCVLSGCDYLASLRGMGLKTSYKVVEAHKTEESILNSLSQTHQNFSPDYRQSFHQAVLTFKHQTVFCPKLKKLVPLNPYPQGQTNADFAFAGPFFDDQVAFKVAMGELDPITFTPFTSKSSRLSQSVDLSPPISDTNSSSSTAKRPSPQPFSFINRRQSSMETSPTPSPSLPPQPLQINSTSTDQTEDSIDLRDQDENLIDSLLEALDNATEEGKNDIIPHISLGEDHGSILTQHTHSPILSSLSASSTVNSPPSSPSLHEPFLSSNSILEMDRPPIISPAPLHFAKTIHTVPILSENRHISRLTDTPEEKHEYIDHEPPHPKNHLDPFSLSSIDLVSNPLRKKKVELPISLGHHHLESLPPSGTHSLPVAISPSITSLNTSLHLSFAKKSSPSLSSTSLITPQKSKLSASSQNLLSSLQFSDADEHQPILPPYPQKTKREISTSLLSLLEPTPSEKEFSSRSLPIPSPIPSSSPLFTPRRVAISIQSSPQHADGLGNGT